MKILLILLALIIPANVFAEQIAIVPGSANPTTTVFYSPSPVNVTIGTVVNWTNIDTTIHTVTNQTLGFDSNIIFPQKSFTHLFNQTGSYDYYCTLHPFMKGQINVQ
ncbi:MAG: hypothetical protein DA328_09180 [Nitrososphaeraceae archaeon]|nr:hypothetical protein [Nitrososphaeraceae archaeon]